MHVPLQAPSIPSLRTTSTSRAMATDSPTANAAQERVIRIYAGQLFDPESLQLQSRQKITVSQDSGLILDVRPYLVSEESEVDFTNPDTVVDLRDATVLPGFVDTHVHSKSRRLACTDTRIVTYNLLSSVPSPVCRDDMGGSTHQRELSRAYSTRDGTRQTDPDGWLHYSAVRIEYCWSIWMAHGIGTSGPLLTCPSNRDLGTEGAEDADIQLRKCMSGPDPLIPGPRYFCANRAIIASGSYGECSSTGLSATAP